LDPLGRAAGRGLGLLVPQGQQLGRAGGQLGRAVAGELSRGGGRAVLAVAAGVATPHRQLRTEPALHVTKEILRARRQQPGIRVVPVELLTFAITPSSTSPLAGAAPHNSATSYG